MKVWHQATVSVFFFIVAIAFALFAICMTAAYPWAIDKIAMAGWGVSQYPSFVFVVIVTAVVWKMIFDMPRMIAGLVDRFQDLHDAGKIPAWITARAERFIAEDAVSEVKKALTEADDPATAWVSQDEAKDRSAQRREAWKKDADGKNIGG